MIQRIQTLFLLGAVIFLALMLFLPLAEILVEDGSRYVAGCWGLKDDAGEVVVYTLPAGILILVSALLLLVNIFMYKRRKLQIRICVWNIILDFGLFGLLYYFWVVIFRQLEIRDFQVFLPLVFPAVAIIFTYLAFRGIRKDELLIRSIDKIR